MPFLKKTRGSKTAAVYVVTNSKEDSRENNREVTERERKKSRVNEEKRDNIVTKSQRELCN